MPTLLFLRGIPASGKSTYAQQWVMEDPENRVRINRDDIRAALTGSATNHTREKEVTAIETQLIERNLREGKDVVSDNTNVNTKFLPKTIKLAKSVGASIAHKDFPITVEEAIRRNSKRDRVVPPEVIQRMYKSLGPEGQFPVFPGSYPTRSFVAPETRRPAICFDMDGTLNNVNNLRHFLEGKYRDFDSFHRMSEFEPENPEVLQLLRDAHAAGFAVLITTARSEPYRETTQKWLDDRDAPFENLMMRKEGDFRSDYEVKKEMFEEISKHYDIVRCVDDNPQAIRAWEENGVNVTKIPFNHPVGKPLSFTNVFAAGVCARCGKPFKGEGSLGPNCRLKG